MKEKVDMISKNEELKKTNVKTEQSGIQIQRDTPIKTFGYFQTKGEMTPVSKFQFKATP